MMELISDAFSPVNLVFTVMLLMMLIYWIMVILGALDIEMFDIDLPDSGVELDVDVDVDIDADADLGADTGVAGAGSSILRFFYVGEVPIMLLVSLVILSMWAISMLANHYLNPTGSMMMAIPLLAGNFVASIFITKVVGLPIRKMYMMLNKDANAPKDVMGRICVVITTTVSERMGQAEVKTTGAPILLNVVSEGGHEFKKGDEAVVTGKNEEKGVYTIAPVDLEI